MLLTQPPKRVITACDSDISLIPKPPENEATDLYNIMLISVTAIMLMLLTQPPKRVITACDFDLLASFPGHLGTGLPMLICLTAISVAAAYSTIETCKRVGRLSRSAV